MARDRSSWASNLKLPNRDFGATITTSAAHDFAPDLFVLTLGACGIIRATAVPTQPGDSSGARNVGR
jgi:hypothetical protein